MPPVVAKVHRRIVDRQIPGAYQVLAERQQRPRCRPRVVGRNIRSAVLPAADSG